MSIHTLSWLFYLTIKGPKPDIFIGDISQVKKKLFSIIAWLSRHLYSIMEICLDNYSHTTIILWLLLISTNTTDSYLDTRINQSLCCAANIPRLETVVPGFQQRYGHCPEISLDWAIMVTPPTHYTLTNYCWGVGSHIQTNRWQFFLRKTRSIFFWNKISAILLYLVYRYNTCHT